MKAPLPLSPLRIGQRMRVDVARGESGGPFVVTLWPHKPLDATRVAVPLATAVDVVNGLGKIRTPSFSAMRADGRTVRVELTGYEARQVVRFLKAHIAAMAPAEVAAP